MSIELQIQSSILGEIIARAVQARLRATCFAPIASLYVDHADVAATPIELVATTNGAIRLRVPIDLFVVRREDVLAASNAVPAVATVPAGTIVLVLEMAATGAVVSLRSVDAELGELGSLLGTSASAAKDAILEAVSSPVALDLTNALKQFGTLVPSLSRVELIGSIVAIRLDPTGNGVKHLFPSHEWGLFMDGASVEQLAISKVPNALTSLIPSMTIAPHWRPAGTVPHVDIDYAGKVPVPDPFTARIDGTLGCDFSLTPTATKFLRTTVHWSLHINLGDFVPGFIDNMVEDAIGTALDPTKFGGTPIGDRAFTLDSPSPLPVVSFGGARFAYASIEASVAGMTIGGPVRLPLNPGKDTLQPSVRPFGLPYRLFFCRTLAESGSGAPPKTVSLGEVSTYGSVWLENCGTFCDAEIVSPGNWLAPYITKPSGGTVEESQEIKIAIPSAVALGITESVRLIVRAARGVRLVDLGIPPPVQVDANGNAINALIDFIDNCLKIPVGPSDEHSINWGSGSTDLTPPLELPDWATYLGAQRGIDVQLVTLSGLEPGELIQFRSRDHAVDVTADRNGRAMVPVLLPLANQLEWASLIRVNRRSIAEHFTVNTTAFVRQAGLEAGRQHRLASTVNGKTFVTTEFDDHVDVHELGQLGAPILVRREFVQKHKSNSGVRQEEASHPGTPMSANVLTQRQSQGELGSRIQPSHKEVELNPQPLPPAEVVATPRNPLFSQKINLPGMTSLVAVPGFEELPIALATMADGSKLVLDRGEDGTTRVAGTFAGPIGPLEASGGWGLAVDSYQVSIYRVVRD